MDKEKLKKALWDKEKKWYKNLWFSDYRDAVIFFLTLFFIFAFMHDTAECREVMEDPCNYCMWAEYPVTDNYSFDGEWLESGRQKNDSYMVLVGSNEDT